MRATLFILSIFIFFGLILWATLSGASLAIGAIIWVISIVITIGYSDTVILYLLGAREVRSSDEKDFFQAASQEAYKLSIKMPSLYYYNGTLERAFVVQNRNNVSLVLNKALLEKCSSAELKAVCFELLLQVKKEMASKRTKTMFLLGSFVWIIHSLASVILLLIPSKDFKKATHLTLNFLLNPILDLMFRGIIGKVFFKKMSSLLKQFPEENDLLEKMGLKLRRPKSYYSLSSRKLIELSSVYKSQNFQSIMALEFLPHEWDYLFLNQGIKHAE